MTQQKLIADDPQQIATPLRQYIERIEKMMEEKAEIQTYITEAFAEAKATGFDTKAMRAVIKLRALPTATRQEQESILELYSHALGME
jgi:uncharacterized protein (UPF0335 family)